MTTDAPNGAHHPTENGNSGQTVTQTVRVSMNMQELIKELYTDLKFIHEFHHGVNTLPDACLTSLSNAYDHVTRGARPLRDSMKGGEQTAILPTVTEADSAINIHHPFETGAALASPSTFPTISVVVLGGCFAQVIERYLPNVALGCGLNAKIQVDWIDSVPKLKSASLKPDVVVLQLGTAHILERVLDVTITSKERRAGVEASKQWIAHYVQQAASLATAQTLLLVQGVSSPFISSNGVQSYLVDDDPVEMVRELNDHMRACILDIPNSGFIDEERIFSTHGKNLLVDDVVSPFFHHAPIELTCGLSACPVKRQEYFRYPGNYYAPRLLCKEYVDWYIMWKGKRAVKCIVCDLDNTLWPGVAGEGDFPDLKSTNGWQEFKFGMFGGIHEALKVMKQRGILLVTCSKGTEERTMEAWKGMVDIAESDRMKHLLMPDDFVLHRINWLPKSQNIAEIAKTLNIGLDSILFIDDNPVERAEVMAALPTVRTLGEKIVAVRHILLTNPCLQPMNAGGTDEARNRSEMVKGQVRREVARSQHQGTPEDFLKTLEIELDIFKVKEAEDVTRVHELFTRTNQFRTTSFQPTRSEILEFCKGAADPDDQWTIMALRATDKFTAYGLVGAVILHRNTVENMALSCRVIGLGLSIPFLCTAISSVCDGKLVLAKDSSRVAFLAKLEKTDRNSPCQTVFAECGFVEKSPGEWCLNKMSDMPSINYNIYNIHSVRQVKSLEPQITALTKAFVPGAVRRYTSLGDLMPARTKQCSYRLHTEPNLIAIPFALTVAEVECVMKAKGGVKERVTMLTGRPDADLELNAILSRLCLMTGMVRSKLLALQAFPVDASHGDAHIDGCVTTLNVFLSFPDKPIQAQKSFGSMLFPSLALDIDMVPGDAVLVQNRDGTTNERYNIAARIYEVPYLKPESAPWIMAAYFN